MHANKPLIITSGEPAGIGPDLLIQLAACPAAYPWVALGDPQLMRERAQQLGKSIEVIGWEPGDALPAPAPGRLPLWSKPLAVPCKPGVLNRHNVPYVLTLLDAAVRGCQQGEFAALVTGPVHKGIINQAGISFRGQTEYLADATHTADVVMMLIGGDLRVALATTHLPLAAVSAAITAEHLYKSLIIVDHALRQQFAIAHPRIYVCGLNPHAGEDGHLGREEIDIIIPTLARLRQEGLTLIGPLPADTLFTPKHLSQADAVYSMYHDQGLPVLKHRYFGQAVNMTLGLPFIRVSVDHGTALDLAGTGQACLNSLLAALHLARALQ